MSFLELKIPPVVLFAAVLWGMWYSTHTFPSFHFELPLNLLWTAVILCFSGVAGFAGVWEFRRHKTTVNPHTPHKASKVVDTGIYRISRNPMYLALLLGLISGFVYLQNAVNLIYPVLFVLYMNRFQIIPEERALSKLYGSDFQGYCQKVRRWI